MNDINFVVNYNSEWNANIKIHLNYLGNKKIISKVFSLGRGEMNGRNECENGIDKCYA